MAKEAQEFLILLFISTVSCCSNVMVSPKLFRLVRKNLHEDVVDLCFSLFEGLRFFQTLPLSCRAHEALQRFFFFALHVWTTPFMG